MPYIQVSVVDFSFAQGTFVCFAAHVFATYATHSAGCRFATGQFVVRFVVRDKATEVESQRIAAVINRDGDAVDGEVRARCIGASSTRAWP